MRVTEITVSAGRTFNHPFESYSNLKPQVTVKAALGDGEDWREATKALQAQAEMLVEDHKQIMLKQLQDLESLRTRQREAANLERTIREAQERLDRLRATADEMPALESSVEGQEDEVPDDQNWPEDDDRRRFPGRRY